MDNFSQTIQSIYIFARDICQGDALWINFNIYYNRRVNGNMTREQLEPHNYFDNSPNHPIQMDISETNLNERNKFEQWMKKNLSHIHYAPVLDFMPAEYITWPYLGSFAIDVDINSAEYQIIYNKYMREDGKPNNIDTCLYIMKYEDAIKKFNYEKVILWTDFVQLK